MNLDKILADPHTVWAWDCMWPIGKIAIIYSEAGTRRRPRPWELKLLAHEYAAFSSLPQCGSSRGNEDTCDRDESLREEAHATRFHPLTSSRAPNYRPEFDRIRPQLLRSPQRLRGHCCCCVPRIPFGRGRSLRGPRVPIQRDCSVPGSNFRSRCAETLRSSKRELTNATRGDRFSFSDIVFLH
jgi:hypothetical protein